MASRPALLTALPALRGVQRAAVTAAAGQGSSGEMLLAALSGLGIDIHRLAPDLDAPTGAAGEVDADLVVSVATAEPAGAGAPTSARRLAARVGAGLLVLHGPVGSADALVEALTFEAAPFVDRMCRFVNRAAPLAHPDADSAQRRQLLELLVGFCAQPSWPAGSGELEPGEAYAAHCLHDDPAGWTVATIVTAPGRGTPPHDHAAWGAAATVSGVERNTRFTGSCPDHLQEIDTQLAPVGGGYLFPAGEIHRADDASGEGTVSVHLLIGGGPQARQHCVEPPRG